MTTMTEAIESRVMTGYEPGIRARQAIIRELARREAAGLKSPSLMLLGEIIGLHWSTVRQHVNALIEAGMVERDGYKMRLTDCGRGAAQTLIEP